MAKKKVFNITGPCIPSLHYMVDTSKKIDEIVRNYIENGDYFTINRARQYGKTTTLGLLEKALQKDCVTISISFEGFGTSVFSDEDRFITTFIRKCAQSLQYGAPIKGLVEDWSRVNGVMDFPALSDKITELAITAGRKVVLMIDEVDKSSNNQLFLDFLGMLREKYISRTMRGTPTFHSVILAGVHDIKNLKMKLRGEEQHSYNSPWNIAARFDVDMSFSEAEIATMLEEYENDHNMRMDVQEVARQLYYYTSGYPFLVSDLCKTIDDEKLAWNAGGVDEAKKRITKTNNTLFDDVIKNLVNNPGFGDLLRQLVLGGMDIAFQIRNPEIDLGMMYGILGDKDNKAAVSNIIFETIITDYYISINPAREKIALFTSGHHKFVKDQSLDMALIMDRFAKFMKEEYRDEDGSFIEREGRLLFLSFLKPIINGTGHYNIESETRGSRRMDVVVHYGSQSYIIELKIWHGEQAAQEAFKQLRTYLAIKGKKKGYLLSFCDNLKAPRAGKTITVDGYTIKETVIAYRDKE